MLGRTELALRGSLGRALPRRVAWDGDDYQARFDRLAATGADVHGEATFVRAYEPATVLDAGCGTGRVAIELACHGIEVVGADVDTSMLDTARRLGPEVTWVRGGPHHVRPRSHLRRRGDGGERPAVHPTGDRGARWWPGWPATWHRTGCSSPGSASTAATRPPTTTPHATAAGLSLVERFATWERAPWVDGGDYAVSVHRRSADPTFA